MADHALHLTDWTLEQLAEGMLPEAEQASAAAHLADCARCTAELEAYQALYAALGEVPRFAPSAGFQDAVMARVRIPQPSPVWVWLQSWMPSTRRGWAMAGVAVAAPAVGLVALVLWLLSQPVVAGGALGEWVRLASASVVSAVFGVGVEWGVRSGVFGWAQAALEAARDVPLETLGILIAVLAVAIPLSVWSLVRLIRAPMKHATYAS